MRTAADRINDMYQAFHLTCFRCVLKLIEMGFVPDFVTRIGIRHLLSIRLKDAAVPTELLQRRKMDFVNELKTMPIAVLAEKANEQHYELPTEYFDKVLGKWKKYSSCLYRDAKDDLVTAEESMLELYCDRLQIQDGMKVLDVGGGWGSFTLFAARKYPSCSFTLVSNSRTQKIYVDGEAGKRGFHNVAVITADMNEFFTNVLYDRAVSIECFEHMKNYQKLLKHVSSWLKPDGLFFCHVFCHKTIAYHFEDNGDEDWMTRYFFSGGTMASLDLFLYFQDDMGVESLSYVNGNHYSRTLEAWLQKHDACKQELAPVFKDVYGADSQKWFVYWRLFYLACSELFNYNNGEEWGLAHYTFRKKSVA
eukprot:jgi/Ulvmu1/3548/UM166_0002.1